MKTRCLVFVVGLAVVCAFGFLPAPVRAGGFKEVSARMLKCAEDHSLEKIAVLEFSARGGAGKSETQYAAEKLGLYLAGSERTVLIERALMESVLKETKFSSAADGMTGKTEVLLNMLSLDAVVTRTVFPDGKKLAVLARLIELRTGRVLLAAEAQVDRLPPDFIFGGAGRKPSMQGGTFKPAARGLYRDALADTDSRSCSTKRRLLAKLNASLVDTKARYWAILLKTPGFSMKNLKSNPGSEIQDPGVKAAFYKLLAVYSGAGKAALPTQERTTALFDLMRLENQVSDECYGF